MCCGEKYFKMCLKEDIIAETQGSKKGQVINLLCTVLLCVGVGSFIKPKCSEYEQLVNHVTVNVCPQLYKRRNVCVPSSDESMLECPIQDPDVSSTVPAAGASAASLFH